MKVYSGDLFKNLIRKYSCDRMTRDRKYRDGVLTLIALREQQQKDKPNGNHTNAS